MRLVLCFERIVRCVRINIRRKNDGEVGERKDNRNGGDRHIVVEVLCKRQRWRHGTRGMVG